MAYTVFSMGNEGKIKSFSALRAASSHNARIYHGENQKYLDNADPDYDGFNQDLMPMFEGKSFVLFDDIPNKKDYKGFQFNNKWYERMEDIEYYAKYKFHNIRKNSNLALEYVVSFSSSDSEKIDLGQWKQANIDWFNKTFNVAPDGKNNVISAICHQDEKTAHIHFIVIPIDENGKLNSQRWIGGAYKMRELRQSYDRAMESLGLEPGVERSKAAKQDLPHIYKLIQQGATLPERDPEENLEEFTERTLEYLQAQSAQKTIEIKNAEDAAIRNISTEAENQRKELELELERMKQSLPKDVKRLEAQKNNMLTELSNLSDELAKINELIAQQNAEMLKNQEIINEAIRYREIKKARDYYRNDPIMNEKFEEIINAIDGLDDALLTTSELHR